MITLPFLFKTGQRIIDEKETDLRENHSDMTIRDDQDQSGSIVENVAPVNDNRRCDSPLPAQLQRSILENLFLGRLIGIIQIDRGRENSQGVDVG